jgi:hypothetical protein
VSLFSRYASCAQADKTWRALKAVDTSKLGGMLPTYYNLDSGLAVDSASRRIRALSPFVRALAHDDSPRAVFSSAASRRDGG